MPTSITKNFKIIMKMTSIKKRLTIWIVLIALLLLIPFLAMQFTEEVNWKLFDFVIMGAALFALAFTYELLVKRAKQTLFKIALGTALLAAFLLFWVNSAIGIIGSENQPANLLYGLVIGVGILGSILSRFKPKGMAYALYATAGAQVLVPFVAILIWPELSWGAAGMVGVIILNGFFAFLFILSAILFNQAHLKAGLNHENH